MREKQALVAWFVFCIFWVVSAYAQDEHPIDKSLRVCIDKSKCITAEMVKCGEEAHTKWDAEINKYYKLLMDTLPGEAKITLEKSQSAWINFRDLEFEAIPDIYTGIIGSFRGPTFLEHKLDILKARAQELKTYYEQVKDEVRILK